MGIEVSRCLAGGDVLGFLQGHSCAQNRMSTTLPHAGSPACCLTGSLVSTEGVDCSVRVRPRDSSHASPTTSRRFAVTMRMGDATTSRDGDDAAAALDRKQTSYVVHRTPLIDQLGSTRGYTIVGDTFRLRKVLAIDDLSCGRIRVLRLESAHRWQSTRERRFYTSGSRQSSSTIHRLCQTGSRVMRLRPLRARTTAQTTLQNHSREMPVSALIENHLPVLTIQVS